MFSFRLLDVLFLLLYVSYMGKIKTNSNFKKRLVKEHYSVDACGDGLEAMDYIDMTSYDGIILDIMLPGKDGYEILRELRQQEDDTPVLLLTAKDNRLNRMRGTLILKVVPM